MNDKTYWSQYDAPPSESSESNAAMKQDEEEIDWSQYDEAPKQELSENEKREKYIRELPGFKGIAAETLLNLSNAMKSGVLFARDIPKMVKQASAADKERPLRPYQVIGGELAEIGKSAVNAPYNLNQFLIRKKVKEPNTFGLPIKIPHIPEETGAATIFGLNKTQPEDRFYKGLAGILSLGVGKGAKAIEGLEGGSVERILPKHLQTQIEKEKNLLNLNNEKIQKFKDALESNPDIKTSKINTLKAQAEEHRRALEQNEPLSKIPEKELPQITREPNTEKMNRVAEKQYEGAKEQLSKALTEGEAHHKIGGKGFEQEIKQVHDAASKKFNDLRSYASDKNIEIDKSHDIKAIKDEIETLQANDEWLPGYAHDTPEIKALQDKLNELDKPEFVKASDVLDVYQTLQKIAKKTHDEIYERGSKLTELERKEKNAQAKQYMDLSERLANVLEKVGEESGDKNIISMLKNARSAWSEYASLYGNPVFQHLERHKAIPKNTIEKLDLGTRGNELLNKIMAQRPDIRKAVFSQKYANPSTHKALLRPNQLNESYLSNLGDVNKYVGALKDAFEAKNKINDIGFDLKERHKELKTEMTKVAEEQKIRNDAIDKVNKDKALLAQKEDAYKHLEKQRDEASARGKNIEQLQAKLEKLEDDRNILKKAVKKGIKLVANYGGLKSAVKG